MSPPPAIEIVGLTRRFGAVVALDDVTLTVPTGAVVGLLGHNGAGKTTTIRLLNGLLTPDAGRASVLGLDPVGAGERVRARTGVLTETPALDERLSARENLTFFGRLFGLDGERATQRAAALLERFDLIARADDRVSGFSRGMKQRLALARALVHDPELLFLDEPTAALDPVAGREVHAMIRGFAAEPARTVVISTHNLVEAQRLCDHVFILRAGRLVASGTPGELAQRLAGRAGLEIEVDAEHTARALSALRTADPIAEASWSAVRAEGGMLSLDGVSRTDVPAIVVRLVDAGVPIQRVDLLEPTLEDAYFALYGQAGEPEPVSGAEARSAEGDR